MTSKISYAKYMQEDIRQRGWLIAVLFITNFFFQPLTLVLQLSEKMYWLDHSHDLEYTLTDVSDWLTQFLSFQNTALTICVIIFAVLCGISGFHYLHSSEQQDLIHSLPIRREKLLLMHYTSGILLFLMPFTLNHLLSLLSVTFQGLLSPRLLAQSMLGFSIHILFFLCLYTITVFSMIITGKLLSAILIILSLFVYGSVILELFRSLAARFFSTYFYESASYHFFWQHLKMTQKDGFSSPLWAYFSTQNECANGTIPTMLLLYACILTVCFFACSIILYRQRPTEFSGTAVVFKKIGSVIKIIISVPVGIGSAFYLTNMTTPNEFSTAFFATAALCSFIAIAIMEFIYCTDIRNLWKKKTSISLSMLISLGIVMIFQFDVFRYDQYVPEKDRVQKMSIYFEGFDSRMNQVFAYENDSIQSFLDRSSVEQFHQLYELAKIGSQNPNGSDEYSQIANVKYKLKSGRDIYRTYYFTQEEIEHYTEEILDNHHYKQELFHTKLYESCDISSIDIRDIYQSPIQVDLSKIKQKELLTIYHEELLELNASTLFRSFPIGYITFSSDDILYASTRPIYKCFTKTLQYLNDNGYPLASEMDASKIAYIKIHNVENGKSTQIHRKEDIAKLLSKLGSSSYYFRTIPYEFTISFENDIQNNNPIFYLITDQIPDILKPLM